MSESESLTLDPTPVESPLAGVVREAPRPPVGRTVLAAALSAALGATAWALMVAITNHSIGVAAVGLAFTTADVVIVKELGLGLALAIALDATLIRSLLVPATMRVLGDWNWWPSGRRDRPAPGLKSAPAHVED